MDSRFIEPGYTRSMPADWFESDVSELVSGSILSEVADFWEGQLESSCRPLEAGKISRHRRGM
jgi:hypothetical protein